MVNANCVEVICDADHLRAASWAPHIFCRLRTHICHINCHNCATHTQREVQRVRENGRSFGLTPLSFGRVSMHISSADTCINVSNRSTWDAIVVLHGVSVGRGCGDIIHSAAEHNLCARPGHIPNMPNIPSVSQLFCSSDNLLSQACEHFARISYTFRPPFAPPLPPVFASNCCRDLTLIFMLLTDWQNARCTSPTLSAPLSNTSTHFLLLVSQTLTKSSVKLLSIFFPAQHGVCVMCVRVWVFLKNRVIQYSLPTRCCFDKFTVCVRGSSYVCVCVCVG